MGLAKARSEEVERREICFVSSGGNAMKYKRPKNNTALSKKEKLALLAEYITYYQQVVSREPAALNRKVPREAFSDLLGEIGAIILRESPRLARRPGPVREFLEANPLPPQVARLLSDEFRGFCLALNALKQWVAAEQAAADRYLLGGSARKLCRETVKTCLVAGMALGKDAELHHPIRDGRPPIFISKAGHASIEGQISMQGNGGDLIDQALEPLKKAKHQSWAGLRRGCLDLLGNPITYGSQSRAGNDRTFARQAADAANVSYSEILAWLDARHR